MSTERERILQLVANGKVAPADAEKLLAALDRPRPKPWRYLFTPLEVLDSRAAIGTACAFALLQIVLSRFGLRFDGALDAHVAGADVPWRDALLDIAVAWPLTALLFWGASRLVARQGRLVDFLAAVGLARLPLLFAGVLGRVIHGRLAEPAGGAFDPVDVAVAFLAVPFVAWFIALLVTGFRTASGLRGVKLALTSFAVVLLAEILSKLVLSFW